MITISRTPENRIKLNIAGFNITTSSETAADLKEALDQFLAFPRGPMSGTLFINHQAKGALDRWADGMSNWQEFCHHRELFECYWLDSSKQLWKLTPESGAFTLYHDPINILAWITRKNYSGVFRTL